MWEANLFDMSDYACRSNGVHFLLIVVDQFTKKLFVAPCTHNNQNDVLYAFQDIFERQTMCKEFLNSAVWHYLKSINIEHVTTNDSSVKGPIVERTNQMLNKKIVKVALLHNKEYLEQLQNMFHGLNNSVHVTTRLAPNAIDPINVNMACVNIEKSIVRQPKKNATPSRTNNCKVH
eukprot:gene13042-biopygen10406